MEISTSEGPLGSLPSSNDSTVYKYPNSSPLGCHKCKTSVLHDFSEFPCFQVHCSIVVADLITHPLLTVSPLPTSLHLSLCFLGSLPKSTISTHVLALDPGGTQNETTANSYHRHLPRDANIGILAASIFKNYYYQFLEMWH